MRCALAAYGCSGSIWDVAFPCFDGEVDAKPPIIAVGIPATFSMLAFTDSIGNDYHPTPKYVDQWSGKEVGGNWKKGPIA